MVNDTIYHVDFFSQFRQSLHQISNSTSYIFNSTFEFLLTLQWLVKTKEAFVGVGDDALSTSPVACSVEALRSLLQLKKGLRFCNLLQNAFWIWITLRFSFVRPWLSFPGMTFSLNTYKTVRVYRACFSW